MADQMQDQEHDSFLDIDLSDVPELTNAPEDEYEIRVSRVKTGVSQKGEKYAMLFYEFPNEPTFRDFSDYFGFGTPDDSDKQRIAKLNRFRDALTALGYDNLQQVRYEELIGLTTWAVVRETEATDQYPESNQVARYLGQR